MHAPSLPLPMPIAAQPADATIPACPNAHSDMLNDHIVKTFSGAGEAQGKKKSCYVCSCKVVWVQFHPNELAPGEDPAIKFTDRAALGGKAKTVDGYKCGDCGEPKKGHVCSKKGGGGLSASKRRRVGSAGVPPQLADGDAQRRKGSCSSSSVGDARSMRRSTMRTQHDARAAAAAALAAAAGGGAGGAGVGAAGGGGGTTMEVGADAR